VTEVEDPEEDEQIRQATASVRQYVRERLARQGLARTLAPTMEEPPPRKPHARKVKPALAKRNHWKGP